MEKITITLHAADEDMLKTLAHALRQYKKQTLRAIENHEAMRKEADYILHGGKNDPVVHLVASLNDCNIGALANTFIETYQKRKSEMKEILQHIEDFENQLKEKVVNENS
jgi:hypothetical protein